MRTTLPQACFMFLLFAITLVGGFSFLIPGRRHKSSLLSSVTSAVSPLAGRAQSSTLLMASGDREPASDEDEWRAMLAAFQMYKAAYGNLKVPLRFIVPGLAPWPEKAWGLKLGQRVAAIRSTGKYVHDEKRRKVLDDMGFVWRLRATSAAKDDAKGLTFDQLHTALVTYREHVQNGKGPISIPNNFVVPDCDPWPQNVRGLPLGKRITSMRSKSFLSANPGAKEKLQQIGFPLDGKVAANDARFQLVFGALQRYKEIYGDLLVPQPFVVPENSKEWPEATWGLRLGARVNAVRSQGTFVNSHPDRRQMLDDIGFVWIPSKSEGGNRRGRRRKEEMEQIEAKTKALVEKSKREEADAPDDNLFDALFEDAFAFDDNSPGALGGDGESDSPKWGLESGRRIEDAARQAEEEAQAAEEYKPPQNLAESLAGAAERAMEVGIIEEMDERKRIKKGKRPKNIPWFNDDFGGEFVFDDVVEALTIYKSLHGDFSNLTDGTFIVPSRGDDFGDLDSAFGMLEDEDSSSRAAAAMAAFEERLGSEAATDDFFDLEEEGESKGKPALASMLAGSPDDWPEHLGGMVLGNIVERIRDGSLEVKHLPERKAKLDELDFDWGDEKYFIDVPFEKAMCSFYAYYLVRGDMFVMRDFVMPDDDPWPHALAGYEIGEAVHRIRELQHSLEAYHPDKVSLLRMIDFAWFPTMAIPLDPNSPEMTEELQMVIGLGHPDYAMLDAPTPMGWEEKVFAAGPFFETDDPIQEWRRWHNWDMVADIWYEAGRRDNAFVLRKLGYPQMAQEHEDKYGPGLFTIINETLAVLEDGVNILSPDDCLTLKSKVEFFIDELAGCKDIPEKELAKLIADLDGHLFELTKGLKGQAAKESADDEEYEYEYEYVEEEEVNGEEEYEYEEYEVEEIGRAHV